MSVGVTVAVGVAVAVLVEVGVGVDVGVAVLVGVEVDVAVEVTVGVGVQRAHVLGSPTHENPASCRHVLEHPSATAEPASV